MECIVFFFDVKAVRKYRATNDGPTPAKTLPNHQLTKTLNQGRNVLVFPEGTRSKDGELKPFKKGAFHLAIAAGADIVPMHIDGTWERLPPSSFWIRPSQKPIQVRIGRPISTQHADAADVLLLSHQAMIELGATSND